MKIKVSEIKFVIPWTLLLRLQPKWPIGFLVLMNRFPAIGVFSYSVIRLIRSMHGTVTITNTIYCIL